MLILLNSYILLLHVLHNYDIEIHGMSFSVRITHDIKLHHLSPKYIFCFECQIILSIQPAFILHTLNSQSRSTIIKVSEGKNQTLCNIIGGPTHSAKQDDTTLGTRHFHTSPIIFKVNTWQVLQRC